jgi:peroxiredoxin
MVRYRVAVLVGTLIAMMGLAAVLIARPTTGDENRTVAARQTAASDRPNVEAAIKALDLIRPQPQKLADDFTLKTPDGRIVRLSEQRGKVVFVNFWATWCPPCREEMPAMERLFQRTKNDGLVMLAVSVDANPKVIAPFVEEQGFTFTIGLDPKMELANAYGVRALPASFIVDRAGYLAALALGPRSWDNAASQLLVEGVSRR